MNDPEFWDDRAIDAALRELHGSKPPDLSARVVLALQESAPGPLPAVRRASRLHAVASGPAGWLAAAVLVLAGVAAGWWAARAPELESSQLVAQIEVVAFDGAIECEEHRQGEVRTSFAGAGASVFFDARAGNRLRCAVASRGQLGPFGIIAASPHTELEVRSMEFSVKQGVVAASALTLSVVAGVVTWHTLTRGETAVTGEAVRLEANVESGPLAAENARLQRRIEQLEQARDALAALNSRTPVAPPVPAPVPEEPAAAAAETPVPVSAAMFHDAQFAGLDDIDWTTVGKVTNEMGPMLADLIAQMEKTGEVPPELAVKIQELNTRLVAQVPAMLKLGMPGFGPNGAYTHPLVVANTLASTLQAAGQSLTPAQQAKIAGLVHAFSIENKSIVDQSRDFDLEHLLAETEMKNRFYKEVSTMLTPEQHAHMYPEGSTGHEGASLFSTGLMTRLYAEAVSATNAADFARFASNKLGEQLGLDEASASQVRAVVERVAAASPELWQDKGSATEGTLRMLKTGRTPAALRQQLVMMREIQRQVALSPEQKKKLASMKRVLVPLPK